MSEIPPVSRIGSPRRWPWAVGAFVVAGAVAWGATHLSQLPVHLPTAAPPSPAHVIRSSPAPRHPMATAFAQPWDSSTIARYDRHAAQDVLTAVGKVYPAFAADGGVVTWQMVNAPTPTAVAPELKGLPANGSVQGISAALTASAKGFPHGVGDPSLATIRRGVTVATQWALLNAGNALAPVYARFDGPVSYLGMLDADSFVGPSDNGYIHPGLGSLASRCYTYRAWVTLSPQATTVTVGRGDTQLLFPQGQTVNAVVRVVLTAHAVIAYTPPGQPLRLVQVQSPEVLVLADVSTTAGSHWYVLIVGGSGWALTGQTFPA